MVSGFFNMADIDERQLAIVDSERNCKSYGQLNEDVRDFIKTRFNPQKKELGIILTSNHYQTVFCYVSALQKGDAVILLSASLNRQLIDDMIDKYKPSWLYGELYHPDYLEVSEGFHRRKMQVDYAIHADLAVLLSTSGTTGSNKLVRLSYRNLESNAASISEYLELDQDDRGMVNLPIHYSYGLSIVNSHLYAGATLLLTDDSVLSKSFWSLMKGEKATSFAGVPYTYQMLRRIGLQKMSLPDVRYFTQAGGRLSEELVTFFGTYASEHHKKFYVMYGQTEASPRISYLSPDKVLEKPSSIGQAVSGGELAVDSETGELVYQGSNVMMGYSESFMDLAKGNENLGTLRTGDLARQDRDGDFYIIGRLKRFIKLFGLRLNLDEMERRIEKALHITAVCTGNDEKMAVLIEDKEMKEEVRSYILNLYQLHPSAFNIQPVDNIPRFANGKINYHAVKDWFK